MITTNQFKNGVHIEVDGTVYRVVEFQHVKPGKGGAFVRTKLKAQESGAVVDKTFRAGEKFRDVHVEAKKMQYLYASGDEVVFMDTGTYDQVSLDKGKIGEALDWIKPNDEVELLYVDEKLSDIQLPSSVELKVVKADPGLRGDTASSGGTKPVTLESGVTVQAPLFISEGDVVKVDTRTREYLQRV